MTLDPFPTHEDGGSGPARGADAPPPVPPRHQRASGTIRVSFRRRGEATALRRLFQEGSAKLRLPRGLGLVPEAVLINTAGGLTGGDVFRNEIECGIDAHAVLTTQACERIYRSNAGDAQWNTAVRLAAGARLDYLPQETILFDGGRLCRRFEADLAAGAALLAVEAVVFGRAARGEVVRSGAFRDRWRIRRAGRLLFADDVRLEGEIAQLLSRPAVLNGAGAAATVLLCAEDCEEKLPAVRETIGAAGGVSAWNGRLLARIAAADSFALRRALLPALTVLTDGRRLPKVWQL